MVRRAADVSAPTPATSAAATSPACSWASSASAARSRRQSDSSTLIASSSHHCPSRKIDSRDERSRLRGIVREFREQHGFTGGVIIRTAAAGRPKEDIVSDLSYFHRVWTEIRQKADTHRAPAVVYQEQSLVAKLLRDLLTEEFSAIRIDNPTEYRRVLELIERIMPSLAPKVKLYEKEYPIFEEYGVQAEIDKALKSKVWLKSGGSIVINQTEALVAIDVNTG